MNLSQNTIDAVKASTPLIGANAEWGEVYGFLGAILMGREAELYAQK